MAAVLATVFATSAQHREHARVRIHDAECRPLDLFRQLAAVHLGDVDVDHRLVDPLVPPWGAVGGSPPPGRTVAVQVI